jgi:hypothetical protein
MSTQYMQKLQVATWWKLDVVEKLSVEAKDSGVECQMVEVFGSPKNADKIVPEF